ncbi:MAG: universal stress protein [Planctomycetia bacterium]|nr:universal stress protein [Planctomycetia bacterium]
MRVLIAVDGSSGSFLAVSQVGGLLTAGKDEVAVYCSPPEFRLRERSVSADVVLRARQALADSIFEEARKKLPPALQEGMQKILGIQDPRHGIVTAAEQWPSDLVAVGARGLGTFERLLLGSVSRAVVHAAKIPVFVARREKPVVSPHGPRVLLACESSTLCRPAAALLSKFSWPEATQFCALTVLSSMFSGRVPEWLEQQARSPEIEQMVQAWAREHEEEVRANLAQMQDFVQHLPPPLAACRPLVAEGEPATEILAAISRERIELVVIGVHRKRLLASAILGSTSEAVLNHATCSVLVVPHQEAP